MKWENRPLTNLEIACSLLGWQGGTIHQVAKETGLCVNELLDSVDVETLIRNKQNQQVV